MKHIQVDKFPEHDGIFPSSLKEASEEIVWALTKIFVSTQALGKV